MAGKLTYRDAGVDIEAGDRFVSDIARHVRRTLTARVVEGHQGRFAGLFSLDYDTSLFRRNFRRPVLVSGTDGVGTKLRIAFDTGVHHTVGIDLVAMSVNDIITTGAEPLFFLDYIATSRLDGAVLADVVRGIADGCVASGCALLGGETAELPGFYRDGEYDLAGFAVGVAEKDRIIDGSLVQEGDMLVGLMSSGLHSNGFSLARKALLDVGGMTLDTHVTTLGRKLGEELLEPTRIYAGPLHTVLRAYRRKRVVRAVSHITGGGLPGNVPRVLPKGLGARIFRNAWSPPPIFDLIREKGGVEDAEMFRVFNMGVGMVLVTPPFNARKIVSRLEQAGQTATVIGRVTRGEGDVDLR